MTYSFTEIKTECNQYGLNLFEAISISELPEELLLFLKSTNVNLFDYKTLFIVGNGGKRFFENFKAPILSEENPLDQFSLNVLNHFNEGHDFLFLYPNEFYLPPLQKIARFLIISHPSPLGLDISHEFGPWFAFRILALSKKIIEPDFLHDFKNISLKSAISPCEECKTRDCELACPAKAISKKDFQLNKCADYRFIKESQCVDRCLSRMACPYKREHQYTLEQINYHMTRPMHLKKLFEFKN